MKLKKGDLAILLVLIIAALVWLSKDIIWPDTVKKQAVIKIDGEIHSTINLDDSNEMKEIPLTLPGEGDNAVHSTIITEKVDIWVEESSCPNKICVKTGKISKPGQSIVCLPGKVVIYIESTEKSQIDDMTY